MSGYTLSHRDKWVNPVFRNLLDAAIWSWMCDAAAWKDCQVRVNGKLVNLKRGELATSERFISEGFNIGRQVTRSFLENIEKSKMITRESTNKLTIITICNYEKYQSLENTANPQDVIHPTHSQPTNRPNKKEDNKDKEKKEGENFVLPDWVPKKDWDDFIDMRKQNKKLPTEVAKGLLIKKLDGLRLIGNNVSEVLQTSITNGWSDLYALKTGFNKPETSEKEAARIKAEKRQREYEEKYGNSGVKSCLN